jgi:hypothetical protein
MVRRYNIRTSNPVVIANFSRLNRESEFTFECLQKNKIRQIVNNINKNGLYIDAKFENNKISLKKINPIKINIALQ